MKNTHVCPKCGGTEIIYVPGNVGAYASGNNIMTGLTTASSVLVGRYVCAACGYSEEWINVNDIPKLKKKFGAPEF